MTKAVYDSRAEWDRKTQAANERKAAAAAAAGVRKVQAVILRVPLEELPAKLAQMARLRLEHPAASMPELGKLAAPPMTTENARSTLARLYKFADDTP